MCGISGIYHPLGPNEEHRESVRSMTSDMVHRGPDEQGFYYSSHVSFGMRRLNVIDVNTGSQPISNEANDVHVIFNGEIYRFESHRQGLQKLGHVFRTSSDTEVIVHLYEEYGLKMFDHFDGMFVFALWDSKRHRLIIARDRFGIKPLFYTVPQNGGSFCFSSELPPLLKIPGLSKELDPFAIDQFFALSYVPHPRSVYKQIRKLRPGHYLISEEGVTNECAYWGLPTYFEKNQSEAALFELDQAINSSVKAMMRSDVPVGAFLSGGLDSSTVVYHMVQESRQPVHTFSVRFKEKTFDEGENATLTSRLLGTIHHEIWMDHENVKGLKKMGHHFGEPFADPSQIPTFLVSQLAREHVTVALSGDGGDEILGGYETYAASLLGDFTEKIPTGLRKGLLAAANLLPVSLKHVGWDYRVNKFLKGCHLPPLERHAAWRNIFSSEERAGMYTPEFLTRLKENQSLSIFKEWAHFFQKKGNDRLSGYQYLDIKTYLIDNNLTKVDRMSMAHSLEVRIPFLDLNVFYSAFRLPVEQRVQWLKTKIALRNLMRNRLPEQVLKMKKKGFGIPLGHWFKGPLACYVDQQLNPDKIRRTGILAPSAVNELLELHRTGRKNLTRQIWNLLCFVSWYENYSMEVLP